ncbi:hypothetical protein CRUP_025913 [Coryphaenoides rupestris]|nr:hypothetical protein CRUP_025913 [Coryphaenoides rupestris]
MASGDQVRRADAEAEAEAEVDAEDKGDSSDPDGDSFPPEHRGGHHPYLQKRQARVTVKYNRRELQRRLDVEKWIDESMDKLYAGKDFIQELVGKLQGLQKQDDLQSEGIEHPVISHSHYRHEPYHFSNTQHQQSQQPGRGHNQTL